MTDVMFSRMVSSNVLAQVHVSPDSRFVIVPLISNSRVWGWKIFDTQVGDIVDVDDDSTPEGYADGTWERLNVARSWLSARFYRDD